MEPVIKNTADVSQETVVSEKISEHVSVSSDKKSERDLTSRIPRFYELSVSERLKAIFDKGWITEGEYNSLLDGSATLDAPKADKMIENVIGVMGLPLGLGLNFLINSKEYAIPLAVEEPSIVAALSSAAKLIRQSGGFTMTSTEPVMIGQIQIVDVPHPTRAKAKLLQRKEQIINLANSLHPKMVARGGGAEDLEVIFHPNHGDAGDMLVVHLMINTCDAMGANLVNTMCEGVASLVERISGGKVLLRILSNLTDMSLVKGHCLIPVKNLGETKEEGEKVRDGIIAASEFASIDPYRAATHNKGIMNGIDPVAIATGNDWRALEAGAHAFAARGSHYTALTRWFKNAEGDLIGEIEIPIKVGIVGGSLLSNPLVATNLKILNVKSARELAEVMGAVGLGQNFSAIKALATDGIQKGHMTLHARSVVHAAGASQDIFDKTVEMLLNSGEIKVWKAKEIITELEGSAPKQSNDNSKFAAPNDHVGLGHGKVILFGEHAVVHGAHALAAPIPLAVRAEVKPLQNTSHGVEIAIPQWGVEQKLELAPEKQKSFEKPAGVILKKLGLEKEDIRIEVHTNLGRAMGMGGSSATAVAIIRALDIHFKLDLKNETINDLAFECEKIAHGNPSGIDNTVATYGSPLLFQRGKEKNKIEQVKISAPITFVLASTGVESLTSGMVEKVKNLYESNPAFYQNVFDEIDALTLKGLAALQNHDLKKLGEYMNLNHGLLNALQVSCWELEEIVQLARENGAYGAKLTGAGGGGSVLILAPENPYLIAKEIEEAGYDAFVFEIQ